MRKLKLFSGLGMIMFSLFAYWQMNDLVQYETQWWQGWFLTYLMTAWVCGVTLWKILPKWCYLLGATLALVHAGFRLVEVQPEETILFNENNPAGNETGGLLIVCLWLGILAFWKRKNPV